MPISIDIKLTTTALERAGGDPSGWFVPAWTLEADKEISAACGTSTTILSMTAPGPCIEKETAAAVKLAREANEFAAAIRDAHPKTYGFFASLPSLLDTKEALEEIAYSLDVLKADGVIIFTRYGEDNHYLGHPDFLPIWEELNRREAVVFVHPTHAVDTNLVNSHMPQPMFDYPHETGRTGMDLIISGNLRRFPNVKIILSHAGGTLPYLINRPAGMLPFTPNDIGLSTQEIVAEAGKFYYDTALSTGHETLDLLYKVAGADHVLFGCDFPNAPTPSIHFFRDMFDTYKVEGSRDHVEVTRENALRILPRLTQ
jgi:6-methylsalicylate decarboxylase